MFFYYPVHAYTQIGLVTQATDNYPKKIAKPLYNMLVFLSTTLFSVIVIVISLIVQGLYNAIAWPIWTWYKYSLKNSQKTTIPFWFGKTPRKPPGKFRNRKIEQLREWPTVNQNNVSDFGIRFFSEEVTIPGTDLDFWGFIQQLELLDTFDDVTTISSKIIPATLPLEKKHLKIDRFIQKWAFFLSQELLYQIQTNPEIASKYLLLVFTYLKFLGLGLDSAGRIRTFKEHVSNKNKETVQATLIIVVLSLASCGFINTAAKMFGVLRRNSRAFGFDKIKHPPPIQSIENALNFYQIFQPAPGQRWNDIYSPISKKTHLEDRFSSCKPSGDKDQQTKKDYQSPQYALPTDFDNPKWISRNLRANITPLNDPIFHKGPNGLLQWNAQKKQWGLPHLSLPPSFQTKEEKTRLQLAQQQQLERERLELEKLRLKRKP